MNTNNFDQPITSRLIYRGGDEVPRPSNQEINDRRMHEAIKEAEISDSQKKFIEGKGAKFLMENGELHLDLSQTNVATLDENGDVVYGNMGKVSLKGKNMREFSSKMDNGPLLHARFEEGDTKKLTSYIFGKADLSEIGERGKREIKAYLEVDGDPVKEYQAAQKAEASKGAESREELKRRRESLHMDVDYTLIDQWKDVVLVIAEQEGYKKGDWEGITDKLARRFKEAHKLDDERVAKALLRRFQATVFDRLGLKGDRWAIADGKIGPYSLHAFALFLNAKRPDMPVPAGCPKLRNALEKHDKESFDRFKTVFRDSTISYVAFKPLFDKMMKNTDTLFLPWQADLGDFMLASWGALTKAEREEMGIPMATGTDGNPEGTEYRFQWAGEEIYGDRKGRLFTMEQGKLMPYEREALPSDEEGTPYDAMETRPEPKPAAAETVYPDTPAPQPKPQPKQEEQEETVPPNPDEEKDEKQVNVAVREAQEEADEAVAALRSEKPATAEVRDEVRRSQETSEAPKEQPKIPRNQIDASFKKANFDNVEYSDELPNVYTVQAANKQAKMEVKDVAPYKVDLTVNQQTKPLKSQSLDHITEYLNLVTRTGEFDYYAGENMDQWWPRKVRSMDDTAEAPDPFEKKVNLERIQENGQVQEVMKAQGLKPIGEVEKNAAGQNVYRFKYKGKRGMIVIKDHDHLAFDFGEKGEDLNADGWYEVETHGLIEAIDLIKKRIKKYKKTGKK
jgi:hypothetical protein